MITMYQAMTFYYIATSVDYQPQYNCHACMCSLAVIVLAIHHKIGCAHEQADAQLIMSVMQKP